MIEVLWFIAYLILGAAAIFMVAFLGPYQFSITALRKHGIKAMGLQM